MARKRKADEESAAPEVNEAPPVAAKGDDGANDAPQNAGSETAEPEEEAAARRDRAKRRELVMLQREEGLQRMAFLAYSKAAGLTKHFPIMPGFKQDGARKALREQLTRPGWDGYVLLAFPTDRGFGCMAVLPFREDVEAELDKPVEAHPEA